MYRGSNRSGRRSAAANAAAPLVAAKQFQNHRGKAPATKADALTEIGGGEMSLSNRPTPEEIWRRAYEAKMRAEIKSKLLSSQTQLFDLVCETLCRERCKERDDTSCVIVDRIGEWKPCDLCHGQGKAIMHVVRSTLL